MSLETEQQGEQEKQDKRAKRTTVEVEASYQPTTTKFEKRYPRETTLAPVKGDVMTFFQVSERTDGRKVYTYHLFLAGQPQDDLNKTLGAIAGEEREVDFQLVEQIVES